MPECNRRDCKNFAPPPGSFYPPLCHGCLSLQAATAAEWERAGMKHEDAVRFTAGELGIPLPPVAAPVVEAAPVAAPVVAAGFVSTDAYLVALPEDAKNQLRALVEGFRSEDLFEALQGLRRFSFLLTNK